MSAISRSFPVAGLPQRRLIHPAARFFFALALASAWAADDLLRLGLIAAIGIAALFVVPLNSSSRPLWFVLFVGALAMLALAADFAGGFGAVTILALKLSCLALSAITAFAGLGLPGAVHAANLVWRPLAILVGAATCGSERIKKSFYELRDVQKSHGLRFLDGPFFWVAVLMFNWIVFMVDLSGSIEAQLSTKWYGAPDFRISRNRAFGYSLDWLLLCLGFVIALLALT